MEHYFLSRLFPSFTDQKAKTKRRKTTHMNTADFIYYYKPQYIEETCIFVLKNVCVYTHTQLHIYIYTRIHTYMYLSR